MQVRIDDFLAKDIAAATDSEAQQRLIALQEYNAHIHELRRAMGEAKTDEEQQALRESMRQAVEAVRDLTFSQQDYLIRNMAEEYGIDGADQQDAFVESVRHLQHNPYFRMSGSMGAAPVFGPRGSGFSRGRPPTPPAP